MNFFNPKKINKWLGYVFAIAIIVATIYISNGMVNQLKIEEEKKIKIIANSLELLSNEEQLSPNVTKHLLETMRSNTTIPILILDKKGEINDYKNIDSLKLNDKQFIAEMQTYYKPIEIKSPYLDLYIYYNNSSLLTQLKYYPAILIIIIALFIWFTLWYFRTLKRTEQSFLWAGLAKETAHQIGTPLSSIMGWMQILESENVKSEAITEINNDVERLKTITERFSKIGSHPELKSENIIPIIRETISYLQNRISQKIQLNFETDTQIALIETNQALFSWVIENLTKNAVDAIRNEGKITINLQSHHHKIIIDICDNGQGIARKHWKKVFEPGFTTKKRGWGLGLSLVKRIIQNYHHGKIFVAKSELGKGTTFRIILKNMR